MFSNEHLRLEGVFVRVLTLVAGLPQVARFAEIVPLSLVGESVLDRLCACEYCIVARPIEGVYLSRLVQGLVECRVERVLEATS